MRSRIAVIFSSTYGETSATTACASRFAARAVVRAFWPVTETSINGVVPTTARRPAGGETWRLETFARSLERFMPLRSATS
jgi:hypothetical protein